MTVHEVVSTYLIQIDYGNATGGPKFPKQISREKESLSHYLRTGVIIQSLRSLKRIYGCTLLMHV